MAIPLRERLLGRFARLTNQFRVWYRLPFLLAMPTLVGHRVDMREHNLSDTERVLVGLDLRPRAKSQP